MFSLAKASAAVLALTSFVQATITIAQPDIKGNSTNTLTWTSTDPNTDPEVFSVELINQVFNSQFALGNNIQTTSGSFTFQLPVVAAGPGYTIEFVNTGNINDIFATSAPFSVQQVDATSTTSTSGASSAVSSTPSVSSARSTPASTLTQTGTSASASASATSPGSLSSAAASGTSASASAASASTSAVPSGAIELIPSGFLAAIIAGAVALLF